jgi:hypothetical protein
MIYRGDVKEGPVISVRRVSPGELAEGKFSFSDKIVQHGDVKTFAGTVPPEALAAGRVVVEFTKEPEASTFPNMKRYRKGSMITSATKQLAWNTAGKGYFIVNTPGTKAVVGFARGKEIVLGNVSIQPACRFASLFITALDREETLARGKRALITAVARQSNTGFKYFTPDNRVLDNGQAPILLEPVQATIRIKGRRIAAVQVLDQDGRPAKRTLDVSDGRFTIDGAKDKTLYYEILFR